MMLESAIGVASMSDSGFGVFAQRMENRYSQHRLNGEYPDHPNNAVLERELIDSLHLSLPLALSSLLIMR